MEQQIGDSVVVKSGIMDPDFGIDISGWQGRIEEIDEGQTIFIRWDSITLRGMRSELIIRCENENLDWEVMTLNKDNIEVAEQRDAVADVLNVASQRRAEIIDDPRLEAEHL